MALDSASIVAALKKVASDSVSVPEVVASDAAIELRYADAASHAARCSADDAAVRAHKALKIAGAEQIDVPGAGPIVRFFLSA